MSEIASFRKVSKTYRNGVTALSGFSLEIREGECIALLGPNGAGKTTAMKILTGILSPEQGEIWVKGRRFLPGDSNQKIFGMAFEEVGLWPSLTVLETLRFVCRLYGRNGEKSRARVNEFLKEFRMSDYRDHRVEELSEGFKRRLNLACAFLHDPEIVILDEPSLGLDVHARESLWEFLEGFRRENRITLLLSTHDMEEASRFGDRVGILNQGKLLALDSPENLLSAYGGGDESNEIRRRKSASGLKNVFSRLTGSPLEPQESSPIS